LERRGGYMENKKAQHTPGPWKANATAERLGEKKTFIYSEGKAKLDRTEYRPAPIVTILDVCVDIDEHEANARLIASSPELLSALKAIQAGFLDGSIQWTKKRVSDSDPYHPANTLMNAAIAKAEGR
jgi:hypothetical protein